MSTVALWSVANANVAHYQSQLTQCVCFSLEPSNMMSAATLAPWWSWWTEPTWPNTHCPHWAQPTVLWTPCTTASTLNATSPGEITVGVCLCVCCQEPCLLPCIVFHFNNISSNESLPVWPVVVLFSLELDLSCSAHHFSTKASSQSKTCWRRWTCQPVTSTRYRMELS